MSEDDKKLLGEVLLIVGGFILGETIVRFFLNLATEAKIELWILPTIAILLIIDGFQLKNGIKEKLISFWIFDTFIVLELILIVLLKNNYLSAIPFLWITLAGSIVTTLSWIVEAWFKKSHKNKKEKNPKERLKDETKSPIVQKEIFLSSENELLRLAIITLLVASMFGILQYFPDGKTFDSIGMGFIFKVIASTMLYATFPTFALYLTFLGLNSRFKKKINFMRLQAFFYDLGIFLMVVIIMFAILICSAIWLLVKFPHFPMSIIVLVIWIFIMLAAIFGWKSLTRHFNDVKI